MVRNKNTRNASQHLHYSELPDNYTKSELNIGLAKGKRIAYMARQLLESL